MRLLPILCQRRACAQRAWWHMLAGASARARTVREHDQAYMSLPLRGRSRRELLSAPPCTAHMHNFSPACWMKFHSPRVISREFGREHQHMMHESCCTYREQHDGVLEAVMAIPRLSRTLEISLAPDRNCHPRKVFHRKMHEHNRPVVHEHNRPVVCTSGALIITLIA